MHVIEYQHFLHCALRHLFYLKGLITSDTAILQELFIRMFHGTRIFIRDNTTLKMKYKKRNFVISVVNPMVRIEFILRYILKLCISDHPT